VLVSAAIEAGVPLTALPGPNAALTALVVSGLPPDRFLFCGFLPRRGSKRRAAIEQLQAEHATLIFYEAPHRIGATLADLAELLGPRRAALTRQLTKPEEQVRRGRLPELSAELAGKRLHGELTLVVEGAPADKGAREPSTEDDAWLTALVRSGLPPRQIRDIAHQALGGDRKALYRRVLSLSGELEQPADAGESSEIPRASR
jgi:16S rRNA (cytidine1402-2'-O)-methyltransferase